MKKRIVSLFLMCCLVLALMPTGAFAADIIASGSCGDNVSWTLDSDGLLTISGNGPMSGYPSTPSIPWNSYTVNAVVIEEGVTSIGEAAFFGCAELSEITFPSTVSDIGDNAFEDCDSLTSVTLPEGITSVSKQAFRDCDNLTTVILPETVLSIEAEAFYSCDNLSQINFPKHLSQIGHAAFADCGKLSISIPESIKSISTMGFEWCSALKNVSLASDFNFGGTSVFSYCTGLNNVKISSGVTSIGEYAFHRSAIKNLYLPLSVSTFGNYAFYECQIDDIYFEGSRSQWDALNLGNSHSFLNNDETIIHFDSDWSGTGSFRGEALDALLQTNPSTYNNDLALIAANLSLKTYDNGATNDEGIRGYLTWDLGFDDVHNSIIYSNNYGGSLAYTIAARDYTGGDVDKVLVIAAQGSTNPYELLKDATAASKSTYRGYPIFDIVQDFYNAINEGLDNVLESGVKYKVIITGHSLGGAAANLVAASITNSGFVKAECSDVFCYTFGAINSIDADRAVTAEYENIHNIYNYMDTFSPFQFGKLLPTGMGRGFGKFGVMEGFARDYRSSADKEKLAIVQIADHINHDMNRYLECVEEGIVEESPFRAGSAGVTGLNGGYAGYSVVACPVDVDIYRDGNLVGRVKNSLVDTSVTTINIKVEDDVKFILYPDQNQYELKITAYDEGSMVFYTQNLTNTSQAKLIEDVALSDGKAMSSSVGGEIQTEEVKLYIVNEDGEILAEVQEDGVEVAVQYTVSFNANGHGTAPASQAINAGEYVTEPSAPSTSGYNFGGWYKESDCITAWDFVGDAVYEDLTLYAKWTATNTGGGGNGGGGHTPSTPPSPTGQESPEEDEMPFTDVPADAYYAEAVAWAVKNGITEGTSATTFSPDQGCTRAQVVTFLWRAAGSPEVTGNTAFSDVPDNQYYSQAVAWAVANNITVGVGNGKFAPNETCTRGQIVTFLWRYENSPAASGDNFADVQPSAFYAEPVAWAVANGITVGVGNNRFAPYNTCTRAQIVTFLYRDMAKE